MINSIFQELKRQWGINSEERATIIQAMRENLIKRNCNNDRYKFQYTRPGELVNISSCNVEDLFAIDGDMNPQGKQAHL